VIKTKTSSYRLQYLDWVRGLGALIMLQGHVFDSFLKQDQRTGGPFVLSQFVGGMPPAIFLFLTGVTLAFLMNSSERKGSTPSQRVFIAFRRSGFLFLVAFLFRLQLWLFSWPAASWTNLLKVDILNCMGFSIAILSIMAFFKTTERVRYCAIVGLVIAGLAPVVSQIDASAIPEMLRAYVVPDFRFFAFFPWGAFVAFGMSAGSIIRIVQEDATERTMQWAAIAGGALILTCHYFSNIPFSIYENTDYWLNSPAQILTKVGVILLMISAAYLWTRYGAKEGWSWVRQLGTTSLLVYWVHIELVYGRWFGYYKLSLNVPQTVGLSVAMILLMLGLSTLRTYHERVRLALMQTGWWFQPKPQRVPGD